MSSIKNIALIMDGNGRWANEKGRPRIWGHIRGARKVNEIVKKAVSMNLNSLTLYAFSTENWSRPNDEVNALFKILKKFLITERKTILDNDIKFSVIGNYEVLNTSIVNLINETIDKTKSNKGLNLSLAINYGGRTEIINAVNKFLNESPAKEITEVDLERNLYNPSVNDIDLVIRTAGEQRVSNFLLWQLSYSEFYFSNIKWPDFSAAEFEKIIQSVDKRDRRFGNIHSKKIENNNLKLLSQ